MSQGRGRRGARPWQPYGLGVIAVALIAVGISELGTPTSSARTSKEEVTAQNGVVQTTVSGTGNVEPSTDEAVNFATAGTLQSVAVKVGQHVSQGQLLATLDPSSAQLQLEQAEATLTAARDNLTAIESGSASSGSSGSSVDASAASAGGGRAVPSGTRTSRTRAPTTTATTTTTPANSTPSPSEVAQAQAQIDSDEASVTSDARAVSDTELYAPVAGTIASLAGDAIGSEISAGGSANNTSNATADSSAGGLGTSGSSSASSSGFATIINSRTLTMTVSLSESDISSVKVGQVATISMSALSGVQLAARVTSISPLGSESNGVVSYDVTLTTTQTNHKVLPGMSATAQIVTDQAQGVTVPTEALVAAGGGYTVELISNGMTVNRPVTVGLRGTSRAVVTSGLKAGQEVQITVTLPTLSSGGATSTTSNPFGSSGAFPGGRAGFRALFGGGGLSRLR